VNSTRQTIAACLIVRDEQERLPAALASVAFCDEVIVVDSGSQDRTVQIARESGAKVFENEWPGFGGQRNFAIDQASSNWILEVDADERVSPQLAAEIKQFLVAPPADVKCCVLPLRHRFLGRLLGPSAKYPAYRVRLFRRGEYRHDAERRVHEGLWPLERTWAFRGHLEHELADKPGEALRDANSYARLESEHVAPLDGALAYAKAIVARPLAKAGYRTIVDGGWRDGPRGLAKIALDSGSDALVWVRRARNDQPTETHGAFGRVIHRTGEVRFCAVGGGDAALQWLRAARNEGADVALVTDSAVDGGDWLHVEPVEKLTPLAVIRALDAIGQMRPVDALVMPGAPPRWLRLASPSARGAVAPVRLAADPIAVTTEIKRATRR
jgi:hypothetical protein